MSGRVSGSDEAVLPASPHAGWPYGRRPSGVARRETEVMPMCGRGREGERDRENEDDRKRWGEGRGARGKRERGRE